MLQYWGNSYRFGYTITDADALTWADNVASSDGNVQLEDAIKLALDTYVQTIKTTGLGGAAGSIWSQAAQLLLPCGPRTLAGALRPLKGAAPTNGSGSAGSTQFASGDYNRKNGLGAASNASKYLNGNVSRNDLSLNTHALFAYGLITLTSGDRILIGSYNTSATSSLLTLDEWAPGTAPVGRAFRSGGVGGSGTYPVSTSTSAAVCMIGSRTAANATALYVDGTTVTNTTNATAATSSQPLYYYSLNVNNSPATYTSAVLQSMGIFSTGLNATQAAALRSATATYVAAVSAAIP